MKWIVLAVLTSGAGLILLGLATTQDRGASADERLGGLPLILFGLAILVVSLAAFLILAFAAL